MIGATTLLGTTENDVLKKPLEAIVDVPVSTGVKDSSEAAAAGVTLHRIYLSQVFNDANLAQLDQSEDRLAIVPKGYNHMWRADCSGHQFRQRLPNNATSVLELWRRIDVLTLPNCGCDPNGQPKTPEQT